MSVQVAIPEIAVLRDQVEAKAGFRMVTHGQFLKLVACIERKVGEHISESTLERIWSYSTRQHESVSVRSLDVLAQYAGYTCWATFNEHLRADFGVESSFFTDGLLRTDDLQEGDRLRIGWQPNRLCIVRYLGNYRFIAERTENSSMKAGDTFSCMQFQKHRELYMDDFLRKNEKATSENRRYAVGQEHGLIILEKL